MPYKKPKGDEAIGSYLNFLQIKNKIFLPFFEIEEDEYAGKKFQNLFAGHNVIPVNCKDIAKEGGVLNCISWNIYK